MLVKLFLKDEVSPVGSILACCRSGGTQSEVVCSYMCLCCVTRVDIVFKINEIGQRGCIS